MYTRVNGVIREGLMHQTSSQPPNKCQSYQGRGVAPNVHNLSTTTETNVDTKPRHNATKGDSSLTLYTIIQTAYCGASGLVHAQYDRVVGMLC